MAEHNRSFCNQRKLLTTELTDSFIASILIHPLLDIPDRSH